VANVHPALQSLVTFRNSQGEAARATLLKLERRLVVFEVYNPYSIVQLSEVLDELMIRRGADVIYQGRAVVTNLVNTGLMLIVSATLTQPWVSSLPLHADIRLFRQAAAEFIDGWISTNTIREGYRVAVSNLRSFLSELNRWLEQINVNEIDSSGVLFRSNEELTRLAGPILEQVSALDRVFEREASQIDEPDVEVHKAFVQRELHPLIMRAPFVHRTFQKPLGYAGDYEIMNMIHRDRPEGPNLYAQLVNAAFVGLPIAQSVRNRVATLESYLHEGAQRRHAAGGRFRALSIGCGPAVEVERFIANSDLAATAVIDLLDFNEETIDHARGRIERAMEASGARPEVRFIHESVHVLLKTAVSQKREEVTDRYDLVYCGGLFDYLSDKVCARLLRLFFSWLQPGGVLLVTNMHSSNPTRYSLEHGAEWYLIYRDEMQMKRLVPGLGRQRTFTDDTGINLCFELVNAERSPERGF
jgi:extracellular factor (EF) 3-hydroxypalmitic acid methyl ester biosynthesis protein